VATAENDRTKREIASRVIYQRSSAKGKTREAMQFPQDPDINRGNPAGPVPIVDL
jgi:hypothetical protein